MKKGYFLKSCSTCQKILKEINAEAEGFEMQNIKEDAITETQLEEIKTLAGNYENLFSKRSMKYRAWDLHKKNLTEEDMKSYILKEYTFLKRPVFVLNDEIFIGNSKKVIDALKETIKRQ